MLGCNPMNDVFFSIFLGQSRFQVAVNVLGDTGVGKTSLVTSLVAGAACRTEKEDRTVGANFMKVSIEMLIFTSLMLLATVLIWFSTSFTSPV